VPHEQPPNQPWVPSTSTVKNDAIERCGPWVRDGFKSIQVNVDENGCNIRGDASNEPSIAIDPTDPRRIVIGWRQFDSILSDFRQAGWAYSHDAGRTWAFRGSLRPGVFGSDPVLAADANGSFYYYSLNQGLNCELFKSTDGGVSWGDPVAAFGGDKPWMTIDRTSGPGRNHIYCAWGGELTRSTDSGSTFLTPVSGNLFHGTLTVGPDGTLYLASIGGRVEQSTNAKFADQVPVVEFVADVDFEWEQPSWQNTCPINASPSGGLTHQMWIDADHSNGPMRGNLYVLDSVNRPGDDPMDVMFVRSDDGGATWSEPIRVNDDPPAPCSWQWFAMMSVAPNGRIDAAWNDTRNSGVPFLSELFYSFSTDGGRTWSANIAISPLFSSWIGRPNGQNKIGDYYHMLSDEFGANIAYAATFNGEQDVYFVRASPFDCNDNRVLDADDIAGGTSSDCNANQRPDECEEDCNGNGIPDDCDLLSGALGDGNGNGSPDVCEVLYVNQSGTSLVSDASSWAKAYRDLQDGLDAAGKSGGVVREIWVAGGTYTPAADAGHRHVSFHPRAGSVLYGGFGGYELERHERDPMRHPTILNGDLNGDDSGEFLNYEDNSIHVIEAFGLLETIVIDGFVITGGNANEYEYSPGGYTYGSGIYHEGGALLLRNCTVQANLAEEGGAIYSTEGSLVMEDCIVDRNGVAALSARGSEIELNRCRFSRNADTVIMFWGRVSVTDSVFSDNAGSPLSIYYAPKATITGSLFTRNGSATGTFETNLTIDRSMFLSNLGGALFFNSSHVVVSNSAFIGNTGTRVPGIRVGRDEFVELVNCTFAENVATEEGGAIFNEAASPHLSNCILWNNRNVNGGGLDAAIYNWDDFPPSFPTVDYSIVQGWDGSWAGVGTSSVDPMLVNSAGMDGVPGTGDDDVRLLPGSPAINAGDPDSTGLPTADLDGHARVLCGGVDIGAYEFGIGDFNCDRTIDLLDFSAWFSCMTGPLSGPYDVGCEAFDFNADSAIDLSDFAGFQRAFSRP